MAMALDGLGRRRGGTRRQRLERHDDRQADVQQQADTADEDRQEPEHADKGRVEPEELGNARGDARQNAVLATAVETAVHLQPPRTGLMETDPKLTFTLRSARLAARMPLSFVHSVASVRMPFTRTS